MFHVKAISITAKNDESTTDTTEIAMYTTASKVENEHIDEDGNIYHDSDADIVGRGEQTLLPITSPQQTSKKDDEAMTTEIYYAQSGIFNYIQFTVQGKIFREILILLSFLGLGNLENITCLPLGCCFSELAQ